MYLAKPSTASRDPWKSPGAAGVSTSAITAIRIVVAVTPTSVAVVAPPVDWAVAAGMTTLIASTIAAVNTAQRLAHANVSHLQPPGRPARPRS